MPTPNGKVTYIACFSTTLLNKKIQETIQTVGRHFPLDSQLMNNWFENKVVLKIETEERYRA